MSGPAPSRVRAGLAWGAVGVVCFSLTWTCTTIAVGELGPWFVATARLVPAAALAVLLLVVTRSPRPSRSELASCAVVGVCILVLFPVLTSLALVSVPASRGAVMAGVMPPMTAAAAALLSGERPSPRFWVASAIGAGTVVAYALAVGGAARSGDVFLLVAVAVSCLGYAVGARVGRVIGYWRVICWALVLVAPVGVVGSAATLVLGGRPHGSTDAWSAFAYLSIVSSCVAFFAWYRGLGLGGTARVGQVQLAQPFLAVAFAVVLVGETISWQLVATGVVVALSAAVALSSPVAVPRDDRVADPTP